MSSGVYIRTKKRGGWKHSDASREKYSQSKLGEKNPRFGKPGLRLGVKVSEESRDKMRKAKIGTEMSLTSGANHWAYGKKYTEEERLERSLSRRGILGSNWQGGKTPLNLAVRATFEYTQWRDKCFKRDGFLCVIGGKEHGTQLNVDHIKTFSQIMHEHKITSVEGARECTELWDIKNGRTLCIECHKATETYAGRGKQRLKRTELLY